MKLDKEVWLPSCHIKMEVQYYMECELAKLSESF